MMFRSKLKLHFCDEKEKVIPQKRVFHKITKQELKKIIEAGLKSEGFIPESYEVRHLWSEWEMENGINGWSIITQEKK